MKTAAYKVLMSLRRYNTSEGTYPVKSLKNIFGETKTISSSGSLYYEVGVGQAFLGSVYNSGAKSRPTTSSSNANAGTICLDIGSGNTAPTENDYCLESPIDLGFSGNSFCTPILDENNNILGIQNSVTYINNTGSEVTIREIGTYLCAYFSSTSNRTWFLIERTVLETPVVVPVNGTVTIAFNMLY